MSGRISFPEIDSSSLPEHCRHGMKLYIERGILPGSFLQAVLANDLMGAFGRADDINRSRIQDYVTFLYNEVPAMCWGSREAIRRWVERGGLAGREDE